MTINPFYPLLSEIDNPDDMRDLSPELLKQLANELRSFTIELVSETGGHLASSLGTVELTIALHHIYNTPDDRLVWDVGHQAYPHKILTGRRDQMSSIRQKGGLAGFPKRTESDYDTFGVGHSSTSISAALGMAIAAQHQKIDRRVVAIIGDGAMTAGMAFEALNHAGVLDANLLVILNDNEMSISPNVGGLSNYLAKVLSGSLYSTMREGSKKVLGTIPTVWELARRAEEHMKGMVIPGTLFEELGFNYIGPIDGHDLKTLTTTLGNLRKLKGPQFLHIVTKKGKGYPPAEKNPCTYHGVGPFNAETGDIHKKPQTGPSYTQVFSDWLCDMAAQNEKLVAITPAMREGSGLVRFSDEFPSRYFDVGIAEQHSVTLAAGMACDGLKPVVAIYSTFLQRAYDQLIHDVAIQNLDILFAIDRAGVVGPDGPTHAGSFDLSFMRCIPNMTIMAPANEQECRTMLSTGFKHKGPCAVRYPRGTGPGVAVKTTLDTIEIGRAEQQRQGSKIAILSFGITLSAALEAAEILDATVVNMRFVKPLDTVLILEIAKSHEIIITIEDNAILGGAGSAVNECLVYHELSIPVRNLGLPDHFQDHASREALLVDACLDCNGIIKSVEGFLNHVTLTKHASLA
ncbi:1-deoxy-D-xylulose 5-phosphate synthase [hydrothermal vent metagenome]|uniref:1-deoxy-D-xylulose-5-phosphate synthase n=1 Tax=hydrothermal vent metagenome TaxID=652676 RepID=A0A3B0ZM81_9ZZZZ